MDKGKVACRMDVGARCRGIIKTRRKNKDLPDRPQRRSSAVRHLKVPGRDMKVSWVSRRAGRLGWSFQGGARQLRFRRGEKQTEVKRTLLYALTYSLPESLRFGLGRYEISDKALLEPVAKKEQRTLKRPGPESWNFDWRETTRSREKVGGRLDGLSDVSGAA